MFTLTKEFRFEASHILKDHDGKCARLHGHSWRATIEVAGDDLVVSGPKENMLVDYDTLSRVMHPFLEYYLDHWHLNDTLQTDRPTSEFIARWLYRQLEIQLPQLSAVTISETCTTTCRYEKGEHEKYQGTSNSSS